MIFSDDGSQTYIGFTNGHGETLDVEDIMHPMSGYSSPYHSWRENSVDPSDLTATGTSGSFSETHSLPLHTPTASPMRTPTIAPSLVTPDVTFSQMSAMSLTDTLVGSPPRSSTPTPSGRRSGSVSSIDGRYMDVDSDTESDTMITTTVNGSRASSPVDARGWPLPKHVFAPDMRVERRPCNPVSPSSRKEKGVKFTMEEPRGPESEDDTAASGEEDMEVVPIA